MILTDIQHTEAKKTVGDIQWRIHQAVQRYTEEGYEREAVERLVESEQGLVIEMLDEIVLYNTLKAGVLSAIDFDQLPRAVVRCRIASGMTQEEFAKKRDVSLAQLQKDERNEYFGFSAISAKRLILLAGYELQAIGMYQPVKKR